MQNKYIAIVIVALVLAVGGYALSKKGLYQTPSQQQAGSPNQTQNSNPAAPVPTPTQTLTQMQAQPAPAPTTPKAGTTGTTGSTGTTAVRKSFTVNGNDASADLTKITVAKGAIVTITFGADVQGTYHGGLDFRSSVVSTGTITPGSTKTVSFTADQSFSFQPYWPATNIAKPYSISIVVN